jgi:uncharacterized membrane protein
VTDPNLVLYIASYPDATVADEDYAALKAAQKAGDFAIVGGVVVRRDADGTTHVDEHTAATAGGATVGGAAGLVVGLFAPPLLAATAVGAGLGAIAGKLAERHDEKQLAKELEDALPPDSSAVLVVADDVYADRIDRALAKADKRISKAVDKGDYEALQKAIEKSGEQIGDAVDR